VLTGRVKVFRLEGGQQVQTTARGQLESLRAQLPDLVWQTLPRASYVEEIQSHLLIDFVLDFQLLSRTFCEAKWRK